MSASRRSDAPCFVYLFKLKDIAAFKVGISIDPLTRLCNLPQFHLRIHDVFDLDQSIVVFAQRRVDARELERAALKDHKAWKVEAPSGAVIYVDGTPTCVAPIRWSAGGDGEWLHSAAYPLVLEFLLCSGVPFRRPSISMADWLRTPEKGHVQ